MADHPVTRIPEKVSANQVPKQSIGFNEPAQFILHTGDVTNYPGPVSLRRPVDKFIRT